MLMMSVQGRRGRGALGNDPVPAPRELAAQVTEVVQGLDVKHRKLSAAASVAEVAELRAALTDLLEVLGSAMQGGRRVTQQRDYARVAREIRAVVMDAGDHREGGEGAAGVEDEDHDGGDQAHGRGHSGGLRSS